MISIITDVDREKKMFTKKRECSVDNYHYLKNGVCIAKSNRKIVEIKQDVVSS